MDLLRTSCWVEPMCGRDVGVAVGGEWERGREMQLGE